MARVRKTTHSRKTWSARRWSLADVREGMSLALLTPLSSQSCRPRAVVPDKCSSWQRAALSGAERRSGTRSHTG